jgi:hypothetical protein
LRQCDQATSAKDCTRARGACGRPREWSLVVRRIATRGAFFSNTEKKAPHEGELARRRSTRLVSGKRSTTTARPRGTTHLRSLDARLRRTAHARGRALEYAAYEVEPGRPLALSLAP